MRCSAGEQKHSGGRTGTPPPRPSFAGYTSTPLYPTEQNFLFANLESLIHMANEFEIVPSPTLRPQPWLPDRTATPLCSVAINELFDRQILVTPYSTSFPSFSRRTHQRLNGACPMSCVTGFGTSSQLRSWFSLIHI